MMMINLISANQVLSTLVMILFAGGLWVFYIAMIKPVQDEKREAKRHNKSRKDSEPVEHDRYENIINDYPTYHRQEGKK